MELEKAKQRFDEEKSAHKEDLFNVATEGRRAAELIEKKEETIEVNNF